MVTARSPSLLSHPHWLVSLVSTDEHDNQGDYWLGAPPAENDDWRELRVPQPPATAEDPVLGRLAELQAAVASGEPAPPCTEPRLQTTSGVLPWEGEAGGDARLRTLVPLLTQSSKSLSGAQATLQSNWANISTHLPGRTGRECRDRWQQLLGCSAAVDETEAPWEADGATCEILGCRRQLLHCFGVKDVGSAVGSAENGHVICLPCLERWHSSQNELLEKQSMPPLSRLACPICKTELRSAIGEVRGDGSFHLGLRKLEASW